ncbi:TetR/AcrR family transcriptional regulator [Tahibacter caeni]|uniref:TetR/AcrR family transcriptional regulator n=1 Tax=Tahibacter caeni TaxID=1453545 RepID=UPI002148E158|nr:TetR/AcrR family transcriptional regulator [Tahibacter caeni]
MKPPRSGTRAKRTRDLVRQAFIQLFFARGYDEISMADIAARAGVGRSTLYEHYRSKQDLMRDTVRYPLLGLTAAVDAAPDPAAVQASLDHFWANRSNKGAIHRESSRRAVGRVLAELIETRLAEAGFDPARRRATSVLVAEMQLGVVHAWLRGELALAPAALAQQLVAMTQAACTGASAGPARP